MSDLPSLPRHGPGVARNQPCHCGSGRPRHLCCDPPRTLVDVFTPLGGQIRQALTSQQTIRQGADPAARAHAHQTVQRALALRRAGKLAEALPAFREAIALAPENALLHHDFGLSLVRLGRFAEAVVPLQQAAALKPNFAEAYYQLGFALQALGQEQPAIAAYRRAVSISPKLTDAHNRMGCLLQLAARHDEAKAAFRNGHAAGRRTPLGVVCEARLLALEENHAAAAECLRQGLARYPNDLELITTLGSVLTFAGDLEGAAAQYEKAIPIAARHQILPLVSLVQLRRITEKDRALLSRMEELSRAPGLTDVSRMELFFALGKSSNDLGDYEGAMRYFDAANEIRRTFAKFDRRNMQQQVDRIISQCGVDDLRLRAEDGCPDETPVLVLGMPRSGTTLVESILSSHPQVTGAGELTFWMDHAAASDREGPAAVSREARASLAADYSALLRSYSKDALRVTDKMPFNFLWLGVITAALPKARIVHCRRHPIDTCISIYSTNFQVRRGFFATRSDLVFYYRQYERLMDHWRHVLPADRFTEVTYEELIANRESETRRLINFCGLSWDDACLAPELNQRIVKTASMWQVRQPVYTSSVARWKRYEPWLGEFAELIAREEQNVGHQTT